MATEPNPIGATKASSEPESGLLASLEQGDPQALTLLFQRHSKLVYSVALRVLRDPAAAEDVLQEVFIQIWRSPTPFMEVRGNFMGWLAVVTRNRAIDSVRRRRSLTPLEDVQLASSSNVFNEVEHTVLLERAQTAIAKLPADQRDALEMAFFDGYTHVEIAEKLGHPLGSVKTRIRSALQSLTKDLNA